MTKTTIPLLLTICMIFSACNKDTFSSNDLKSGTDKTMQKKANGLNQLNETAVLDNFDNALNDMSTATVADLMSPSYQSTSAYISLSNASIHLLQAADALDSIKFHPEISDNSDPRLIVAAQLFNEIVKIPHQ